MRYRLDISYDGTAFHGWAAQPGLRTVQGELEMWVGRVLRLDSPVELTCAGRTDAGVHARGQVAHFDLTGPTADEVIEVLPRRLRRALPEDLVVRRVQLAPAGFDARFSAIWRRYAYRVWDTAPDPLLRNQSVCLRHQIDVPLLNRAGSQLIGLHDFAAFCRGREGATTIRDLKWLTATRLDDGRVEIGFRADAFCHSMVRSLSGALLEVATGRRQLEWLVSLLKSDLRSPEVPMMPAHGLVLEEVGYPADSELAARASAARNRRTLEDPSE